MDDHRRRKLLRRLAKLLRLADDGAATQGEAEAAYLAAQRLMAEEGMSLEEVDALTEAQQNEMIADEVIDDMGVRHVDWRIKLASTVGKNFRAKVYIHSRIVDQEGDGQRRRMLRFLGLDTDVAMARDVYKSARACAERLSTVYAADDANVLRHIRQEHPMAEVRDLSPAEKAAAVRQIKTAWQSGFVEGLAAKFREQLARNPSMALMVVVPEIVDRKFAQLNLGQLEFSSKSRDSMAARRAGYLAGKEFEAQSPEQITAPLPRLEEASA